MVANNILNDKIILMFWIILCPKIGYSPVKNSLQRPVDSYLSFVVLFEILKPNSCVKLGQTINYSNKINYN